MDQEQQLQTEVIQHTNLSLAPGIAPELFRQKLAEYINLLINTNFSKLVLILYRLDINEKKLKQLLASSPGTNAGSLIAALIIERQLEKIQSRKRFKKPGNGIPEEDRW